MAFQIKDFASVSASLINLIRATTQKVTDFNVGSVVRSILDSVAAEIDELYQQMFIGLKEAIPVATYNSFNFEALQAQPASGTIRVTVAPAAEPVTITAGTNFTFDGARVDYENVVDVVIPAGVAFVDVPVVAVEAGSIGNIGAGQTFRVNPPIPGMTVASNPAAFASGTDAETDEDRKLRFNAFIQSLNRGTVAALIYGMRTTSLVDSGGNVTERVAFASVVEPWLIDSNQPISLVRCYVHNGVGATSSALVNKARDVLYGYRDPVTGQAVPGWKAAGVRVEVFAATEQLVPVTGVLTAEPGFDKPTLIAQAEQEVLAYLLGLEIGETALRSEIIARVMAVPGVYNFVLSAPVDDVDALDLLGAATIKLMPGSVAIT